MKTASWFLYSGTGRIAICRSVPRATPAGYRVFKALAPGPWFNAVPRGEYDRRYHAEILKRLNPREVWDRLHDLAGGHEPVLMCYERPPFTSTNWCHRVTLVKPWLEQAIGQAIVEIDPNPAEAPNDTRFDVTPFIGRSATIDGRLHRVIGPDPDNPGQAIVETEGRRFPASPNSLRRHFRR